MPDGRGFSEKTDAPTFFTRPKVKNCLRAAAPPILIGRSRRRGEKRGERIDGIEPLCGSPRRSRSTSKRSRSIESPHERFVAIESRRGESSSALPSPTVVARSRRGGKSTHRAQPNGSSRRSPLNAQLSATGVCHDVPDLRRRSTRQQRLHHVDSRLGFPAGEPPGRQVPSIRFSPLQRWRGVHRMMSKTRVLTRLASLSQLRSRISPANDAATIPTRPR